jgi:hypothetical protein
MAAIPAPESAETPAAVLAAVRNERAVADRAEARILTLALDWAAMHSTDSLDQAATWPGSGGLSEDRPVPLAGPGAPLLSEFCVAELAAALRLSTDAGRSLLAEAIELGHRLPATWRRVRAGDLPAWRARRIARSTLSLAPAGAAYVDRQVAPFAHRVGLAQLDRLVEEALVRHQPEEAAARRRAAADGRHVHVQLGQVGYEGTVQVVGELDLADALDLDTALSVGAARLAALGCDDALDVRRAHALGELARGAHPQLPLNVPGQSEVDPAPRPTATGLPAPRRHVVLNVHLSDAALTDSTVGAQLARVDNTRGFVDAEQVRAWCGVPGPTVTVRPVLDLAEHLSGTGYQTPDRLVEQSALVDETCVFPWCTRPARHTDCDHVVPHAAGGGTCSCNIARLCRRHHRLKTHTPWRYAVLERGNYLWTSPHGYQFLRDRTGTLDVSPREGPRPSTDRHLLLVPDP